MDVERMRPAVGRLYTLLGRLTGEPNARQAYEIDELVSAIRAASTAKVDTARELGLGRLAAGTDDTVCRPNDTVYASGAEFPDHNTHVEGDEYVCARCHKRWALNDTEIPPCTD